MQQATAAVVELPIVGELPSLGSATGWLNSQPLTAAVCGGKSFSSTSAPTPASTGYASFPMFAQGGDWGAHPNRAKAAEFAGVRQEECGDIQRVGQRGLRAVETRRVGWIVLDIAVIVGVIATKW
jgi:hypothetical protein